MEQKIVQSIPNKMEVPENKEHGMEPRNNQDPQTSSESAPIIQTQYEEKKPFENDRDQRETCIETNPQDISENVLPSHPEQESYEYPGENIGNLLLVTRQNSIKCVDCGKTFRWNYALRRHMLSHTGEKPYKCDICQRDFTRKYDLKRHSLIHDRATTFQEHSEEKPFKCDNCSFITRWKRNLKRHSVVCGGNSLQKRFQCRYCKKDLGAKHSLHQHLLIHTNETPFECDFCGKAFARSFTLKQHMATHSEDRPFNCDRCDQKFKRKGSLHRHLKTHAIEKAFECLLMQTTLMLWDKFRL